MAGSWERLGMAWAGARPEDVAEADREATERSRAHVDALIRRQDRMARYRRDDEGETQRQMLDRQLRND